MSERPAARFIRPGELLAIDPGALREGPQAFFWLFGGGTPANERRGDVAIVHVRDALDHHADSWGDNYESLLVRIADAMSGADQLAQHKQAQEAHKWNHGYEKGYQPLPDIEQSPPVAVLVCFDSPGGVVSGLNETVFAIQKMRKSFAGKVVAYVNETAASAAYALACACEQIICPPSAIVGSIGVISTMVSQAEKNQKDGIDVRLITSGTRKSDGHPHTPITDAALNAEAARVEKLAVAFFKIAAKARGLSVDKVRSFQAGIYLGNDAKNRGLVDEVMSLNDVVLALGTEPAVDTSLDNGGGSVSPTAKGVTKNVPRNEVTMSLQLDALIKKTAAALAKERDPEKVLALAADLTAYKKTKKHVEHVETEEDDDKDDEDEDGDEKDDDEEGEEKKASKEESEEKESKKDAKAEDEEEGSAKASLHLLESMTGRKGASAIGAATALFTQMKQAVADTAKLKAVAVANERAALIERAEKYVPKRLVATLAGSMTSLRALVEEAEKGAPMVVTEEGELLRPKATEPGSEESLPKDILEMIDEAVSASCPRGMKPEEFRALQIKAHLKAHNDRIKTGANGAGRF